ncbi:putative K+/H+-antiporter [Handroanthus impetiginosus]|uniref:Putative K+/H+-antiporter n=1 Tax=Handroanthus impetiginosus TaxID=429701 RepID=A0A2G9HPE3_9LAMI|nr:putative K+/H+-antiporter [Handroanthus impetiginosus]
MVIQIIGGLILGPSFLGRIAGFTAIVYPFNGLVILDTLAVFGYMIYFFLIGVQMDPWILTKIEKKDVIIGISTVSLAMVLSLSGAFILLSGGFPVESQIASSLPAVATSSSVLAFPIIAHYLTELKMVNCEFGRMALASSLISNLFGFCIITIVVVTKQTGGEMFKSMQTFVGGLGFAVLLIFIVRPVILWALRRNPAGEPLKQGLIFVVLVGVLVTGFCSKAVGLNIFFGPLLYGITIPAGPPLGSAMMEKLDLVTSWLFMPLYFVKNGLVTDVFSVKLRNYLIVQCVILLACIGKFLGAMFSSIYNKVPLREAVQIGLVVNVQGALELGMFKLMKQNQAIHEDAFVVMCISMLIVTATVTPIIRYLYDPLRRHIVHKRRTIMDLKPDSELRVLACIDDQESVPTFVNLIKSLHPTKRSPIDICLVHLVELVGRAHPILIAHKLNRVDSRNSFTSRSIVNAFKNLQRSYHGIVTLQPFTSISPYSTMHEGVCEMAIDRRVSLIITSFHRRLARPGMVESSGGGIKIMNDKILVMAPCTVAIVVDRAPVRATMESHPLCHVAVFFIGGADDLEALAIGARMVAQTNVNLTIIRVLANTTNAALEGSDETRFDNDVLNEFRSQMAGNQRFMYLEEEVGDGTGTIAVIRSIENHYELILVGRYHDTRSPLMLGLSAWGDDSELGAIGDMFALADSNSSSTVVVVQQNNDWKHNTNDNRFNASTSIREGPSVPLRQSAV